MSIHHRACPILERREARPPLAGHPPLWGDEAALKQLGERLRDELQSTEVLDGLLVGRIISSAWRLQRLGRVGAGVFTFELYVELAEWARREANTYTRTEGPDDTSIVHYLSRTIITDEQKHRETTDNVRKLESMRDAETATLGQTFVRDASKANSPSQGSPATRPR